MPRPKCSKGRSKARDLDRANKHALANAFVNDEDDSGEECYASEDMMSCRPGISRVTVPSLKTGGVQRTATLEFKKQDLGANFADFLRSIPGSWHELLRQKFDERRANYPVFYRSGPVKLSRFGDDVRIRKSFEKNSAVRHLIDEQMEETRAMVDRVKSMIPSYLPAISKYQFEESLVLGQLTGDDRIMSEETMGWVVQDYGKSTLPGPCQLLVDQDFSTVDRVVLRLEASFQMYSTFGSRQMPIGVFLVREGWCYMFKDEAATASDGASTVELILWTGTMFPAFFLKVIVQRLTDPAGEFAKYPVVKQLRESRRMINETISLLFSLKERFLTFLHCHRALGHPLPVELIGLVHSHVF